MAFVSVGSVFILFLIFQGGKGYDDLDYSYDECDPKGPSHWAELYPDCGAPNQSPIELDRYWRHVARQDERSEVKIKFYRNHDDDDCLAYFNVNITNNGHTAILRLILEENDEAPQLTATFLDDIYLLDYIQFRWGPNGGSEHTTFGNRFILETQVVFSSKNGDLVVFSILYEKSKEDNRALAALAPTLHQVEEAGTSAVSADRVFLYDLFSPINRGNTWYYGSMTSPPCQGNVTWIIDSRNREVSGREVEAFRKLKNKDGHPININYRPVQSIDDRKLYKDKGSVRDSKVHCNED